MKVGFTGTQVGMTDHQKVSLRRLLKSHGIREFHYGDCIGSDEQAHKIARDCNIWTVKHPPSNTSKQAHTEADEEKNPQPYLDRNRSIVGECDILVATPGSRREKLRSGTWSTIRYARKVGIPIYIIQPGGKVMYEEGSYA